MVASLLCGDRGWTCPARSSWACSTSRKIPSPTAGVSSHLAAAVAHARCMVEEGAAIIDVGGESTRPGAASRAVEQELRRVIPVVEALARTPVRRLGRHLKPEVMRAAVAAGAGLINDVRACGRPVRCSRRLAGSVPRSA
jgi:dihydropteroate synthase